MIISVKCQNPSCGRVQKMELRKPKVMSNGNPNLRGKYKKCVVCERRFKVDGRSVI